MSDCPKFLLFSKQQHVITRFIAAFIVAPLLIYWGKKYRNIFLQMIGWGTLFYDMITFIYTFKSPDADDHRFFSYSLIITVGIVGFIMGATIKRNKLYL